MMYGVKLGALPEVPLRMLVSELEGMGSDEELRDLTLALLLHGADAQVLRGLLDRVDHGFGNVPWLRDYLASKVLAVIARPGGTWFRG
jgi:hypothetical protein